MRFIIERQLYREKVGELLAEKILYIAESMNRPSYVPKMPNQPELDLIFDTGFVDIQPYLFKVSIFYDLVFGAVKKCNIFSL
jgi:autophagy-related protein 101